MDKPKPVCVDCTSAPTPPPRPRPAPFKGPRCRTCHRVKVKAAKAAAAERRIQRVYGLAPGQYDRIKEHQGGVCALCLRATGASKRLATDHDHACCSGPTSCGDCVRGVLCSVCNRLLGHAHDDPEFFRRCIAYLEDPPAKQLAQQAIQANWDLR